MQVVYSRCAGLDVHKKSVVACVITPNDKRGWHKETRTFSTMTKDLLNLSDWLASHNCTHVAMESTGEYWRPVFNILEGNFEVMLVNARHIKDVMGVSGRAMLAAIVEGNSKPELMAELAKGTMRKKHDLLVQALEGRVRPHQRFILAQLLGQIDSIDETIECFEQQIEQYCRPFEKAVELIDSIPGIARRTAEIIVAEIGTDMTRFPTAQHLAAWAGLAPGNYESGGKKLSSSTRKGNRVLRTILVQAAHALARTKTYLAAQFRRISGRRGKKRAAVAVAHSILKIAYHLISRQEVYQDLGADYFDQQRPESVKKRLVKRLEKLGYQVTIDPVPATI